MRRIYFKTLINPYTAALISAPLLYSCGAKKQHQEKKQPNILFILSDDHTSQAWGVYGGVLADYAKNDNIKKLADEGCVLDNAMCTNSLSTPSRASIHTGAYSHKNQVYTLNDELNTSYDNIAKELKEVGYQTSLYGKWHLKSKPQGFDDWAVFFDQGRYWDPIFKTASNWVPNKNVGDTIKGFSTDIVADKTIRFIKGRDKDKPFATFCQFKATHEPWDFPERNKDLYKDVVFPDPVGMMNFNPRAGGRTFTGRMLEDMAVRWESASTGPWWCDYPGLPFKREGKSKEADRQQIYQKMIRDFLRCGATIDQNIGRLLDCLDEEGIANNTIVVYVADQGYFLGEHGMFDKRMMYEQPLHMPFVIRYPDEIPAGTRNKDIILNIDMAATLADYAGAKAPDLSQGRSFRANLRGETPSDWRKEMYYRYWVNEKIRPAHFGIRNERYTLMFLYGQSLDMSGNENVSETPTWEFYDLQKDPDQMTNQYNNKAYASIIQDMKVEMMKLRQEYDDTDAKYPVMQKILKENKLIN